MDNGEVRKIVESIGALAEMAGVLYHGLLDNDIPCDVAKDMTVQFMISLAKK